MKLFVLLLLVSCLPEDRADYVVKNFEGTWVCEDTGPYAGGVRSPVMFDCEHVLDGRKVKSMKVGQFDSVSEVSENAK
jgi:hypothetical protein